MPSALRILIDFGNPVEPGRWDAIDDRVMGGCSQSSLDPFGGRCAFRGTVSTENGGGFASVRALLGQEEREALRGATALVLRCRGDGRTYSLRLRVAKDVDGTTYGQHFPTRAGQWTTVALPLDRFVPTRRGSRLPDSPPLDLESVQSVGLMIASQATARFCLELESLGAESHADAAAHSPIRTPASSPNVE